MKLLRYGPVSQEKPGLCDADGKIRDLSGHVSDIGTVEISPEGLARLAAIDVASLPVIEGSPRIGVPVAGSRKFIAVGLNYADHAAESNMAIPTEPLLFTKAITCLCGPNDDVIKPRGSTKLDWEVELGIVIGKRASYVSEAEALDYIAGYTDLMKAFGANNDAGASHFITNGFNEGRSAAPFNVGSYESAHPDLIGKYASNDAFLTAYINTYVTSGKFLT